jgi:hypothetical protein
VIAATDRLMISPSIADLLKQSNDKLVKACERRKVKKFHG